jgi:uncharacterized protein YyaL (SSP411 family)
MKTTLTNQIITATLLMVAFHPAFAQGSNHLKGQPSPYLQRSANQPVDWHPFGKDAFEKARRLNRPILLDVGAVWCPWCARMDAESYTVAETAAYINQHFIAVKVDYDSAGPLVAELQRAQAVLNLPAGLPLTSFITPGGELYYGAGYLPAIHAGDKVSLKEAMTEALRLYKDEKSIRASSFMLDIAGFK